LPASAAQVFGPSAVDPGLGATGESILLTMNTTLPAGGKNIIVVSFLCNVAGEATATFRIKKGTTVLYETLLVHRFDGWGQRNKPIMVIAVDNNPSGNDVYTFTINKVTAGSSTGNANVQGIVIKVGVATWSYNTVAVGINGGSTATVTSQTVSYTAGSKVAVIATVYGQSTGGDLRIGAGNMKIKKATTIVSSNQFNIGTRSDFQTPSWMSLTWLDTNSGSVTYSVEVTNGSTSTINFYASLISFVVNDGAFLDTGSVALSNGAQVTVGSLSTTLIGDVVVIGLAAAENTSASTVLGFNVGDVVLQKDNATTSQISNSGSPWVLDHLLQHSRSGVLPLFRFDTGVTNPSYQLKMTTRGWGINGEAKILAFSLFAGVDIKKVFGEMLQLLEQRLSSRRRFRYVSENVSIVEAFNRFRNRFRYVAEQINLIERNILSRICIRVRNETINVIDAFQRAMGKFRQILEALNIVELVSLSRRRVLQFSEMVRVSEIVTRFRQRFREVVEVINLNEEILISRWVVRAVGEFVNLLENVVGSRILNKIANETERLVESFVSVLGKVVGVIENVRTLESTLSSRMRVKISDELVRIGEFVNGVRSMFIRVLESVNVIESITSSRILVRVRNEFIEVGELFSSFMGRVKVVVENIRIIETLLLSIFKIYIKRLKSILRGSSKGGEL